MPESHRRRLPYEADGQRTPTHDLRDNVRRRRSSWSPRPCRAGALVGRHAPLWVPACDRGPGPDRRAAPARALEGARRAHRARGRYGRRHGRPADFRGLHRACSRRPGHRSAAQRTRGPAASRPAACWPRGLGEGHRLVDPPKPDLQVPSSTARRATALRSCARSWRGSASTRRTAAPCFGGIACRRTECL